MTDPCSFNLPHVFSYRGWSIRYLTRQGDETPTLQKHWVVFVHGTPWSSSVFRPMSDALYATGRLNIMLYDLAGYGQSQNFSGQGSSEPDASVKTQGEALAALLDHLQLSGRNGSTQPHIVAHDIAGVISLRAHLLHECEYRSLCLLDTNCVLPWGDTLYKLVRSDFHVFEQLPVGVFEGALRAIIQSALYRYRESNQGLIWQKKT
ncbi:Alpha/Beta hydrolase protein [Stachybotrys elegans]|uniref:Alpha/Beta hydrolase protein n=1 Tax=Stachybotrys elegans TaxID=80388 RepID=A0A8K0WK08_9HYPO|nr:Alpha/Beta hydrolase protein [Stachybotrys elegans]